MESQRRGESGGQLEVTLKKGEAIEATPPKPANAPPAPADKAEPVVIRKPSGT